MSNQVARRLSALLLVLFSSCDTVTQAAPPPRPRGHPPAEQGAPLARGKESAARLLQSLPHPAPAPRPLPFEVTRADYYDDVAAALKLTDEERRLLAQNGFVIVDHDQRYTFASAYLGVYTRDLPVLITTDSILHAYHRAYDGMLRTLEQVWMADSLETLLVRMRVQLGELRKQGKVDEMAGRDADDYLRVALALLLEPGSDTFGVLTKPHHADDEVPSLVASALAAEAPRGAMLRGHGRSIDFTQFKPRGHYTQTPKLSRYFRSMMWLGRADTGFWLTGGDPTLRVEVDADRELAAAGLVARLLKVSETATAYADIDTVYRQFVGESDNLSADTLYAAARKSGGAPSAMRELLRQDPDAEPRIVSSMHVVPPNAGGHLELPMLFQVFGQRFTIDAGVLQALVHDRLMVDGKAVKRMMPSPLDVAAALGNDEAVRLLQPELEAWGYAPNLTVLRKQIESLPSTTWEGSLASGWLAALRTLHPDDVTGAFPAAMNSSAWQRKMLGTELASWSELRHDNVLASKESYSIQISCAYPYGYVEPYPAFYRTVGRLARSSAKALSGRGPERERALSERIAKHFEEFAAVMIRLETLATKELAAEPFSKPEQDFLKRVAFNEQVGCGGPDLSGWYASLFFDGEDPEEWKPTVAAVHSVPTNGGVDALHVGVGDARYLVAVLDNEAHLGTYVGPVYSYYEAVLRNTRLTDEEWGARIKAGSAEKVPDWLAALGGKPTKRALGPPAKARE